MKPDTKQIQFAALLGFLGVALGAFGAHGLEDTLKAHGTIETWKTASQYHLIHAVVLLVLGLFSTNEGPARYAWRSLMLGVVIFSGSLYILSVTGVRWLGAITPIGGLLMLIGWLLVAIRRWPRA